MCTPTQEPQTRHEETPIHSDTPQWCVYALRCRNNAIYIGSTNDLEKRLAAHASGKGSKFVRAFSPFSLAKVILCEDGTEARRLEYRLKKLKRHQKLKALGIESDGIPSTKTLTSNAA